MTTIEKSDRRQRPTEVRLVVTTAALERRSDSYTTVENAFKELAMSLTALEGRNCLMRKPVSSLGRRKQAGPEKPDVAA